MNMSLGFGILLLVASSFVAGYAIGHSHGR